MTREEADRILIRLLEVKREAQVLKGKLEQIKADAELFEGYAGRLIEEMTLTDFDDIIDRNIVLYNREIEGGFIV